MITEITLKNFKSHKHTVLKLDESSRLHALVGQNNSGKTSILQALDLLSQLTKQPLFDVFQKNNSPEYLVSVGQKDSSVDVREKNKQDWCIGFSFEQKEDGSWLPDGKYGIHTMRYSLKNGNALKIRTHFSDASIAQTIYLKLVTTNLAQPTYSDEIVPVMAYDGSGLAPMLDYVRSESPSAFQALQTMLQQIVPSVKKVDIRRAKVDILRHRTIQVDGKTLPYEERQEMVGQEIVLSMQSGERLPAHLISEGTMLALGLLAVLFNPQKPNLLLLDDVEQGLHPHAQRQLIHVLKQILEQDHNLQIIFTTHSPYIIDELVPSQVHLLYTDVDGYTVSKRLDEHPNAAWATQTLTTGEFWDAEGEAWVAKETNKETNGG